MNDAMLNELAEMLNMVEDSYFDFISAMLHYAKKKPSRAEALICFMKDNPNAKSADVIRFVAEQPDFFEDAAYMNVG